MITSVCKYCKEKFKAKQIKSFCSNSCRCKFWYYNKKNSPTNSIKCQNCEILFEPPKWVKSDQKNNLSYCSDKCRNTVFTTKAMYTCTISMPEYRIVCANNKAFQMWHDAITKIQGPDINSGEVWIYGSEKDI
jgi:hypothetical protein